MSTNLKALISLEGNSAKLVSEVEKANKSLSSLNKSAASAQSTFAGLLKAGVALGALTTVYKTIKSFVDAAAESEKVNRQLAFTMETLGYSWKNAQSAVEQFAKSVQDSTRYNDEEAVQSLNQMFLYTNKFSEAQKGAKLAMDMSSRTGMDLQSSTQLIGMAMAGNVERLGRYIPELRNLEDKLGKNATAAEKATYAMGILEKKFSGTAQADMNTYVGKVKAFQNAWDDFKESLGSGLLPVLKVTFDVITKIIKAFQEFNPAASSAEMIDKMRGKLQGRLEEQKGLLGSTGLSPFQIESITNEIKRLEGSLIKLDEAKVKNIERDKQLADEEKKIKGGMVNLEDEKKRIKELLDANKDLRESWAKNADEIEKMGWGNLLTDMGVYISDAKLAEENTKALKEALLSSVPVYEAQDEAWIKQAQDLLMLMKIQDNHLELLKKEKVFATESETRSAKVGLGWMRPAEAGLADIAGKKDILETRLANENQIYETMLRQNASAYEQGEQLAKIREIEKELATLEASRLRYISEYGTALGGLVSGFQKYATEVGTAFTQMETMATKLATGMEGAFSNFFQSIFDNTKSWKERMEGLFKGLANSFIKALSDMMAKKLVSGLFDGSSGGTGTGLLGGVVSWIGKLFSPGPTQLSGPGMAEGGILPGHFMPIRQFASGGVASRPTLGLIAEAGQDEAVVPLKGGAIPVDMKGGEGGGNTIIIMNIEATDVDSFERKYGGSVNKIFKTSARKGGAARKSMRSYI